MKKGKLLVFIFSFLLLGSVFFTPLSYVSANTQQNNSNHSNDNRGKDNKNDNNRDNKNNKDDKNKDKERHDRERKDKEKRDRDKQRRDDEASRPVSVPEFSPILGGVALLTSTGSFLFLKKKKLV